MMKIKLGVSGDPGSFSEEAGLNYAERAGIEPSLIHLTDMESVLSAVEKDTVDMGIFPVVNLHGGLVNPAFKAMGRHLFLPLDEYWLDVKQCLLTLPGTAIHQIDNIVSHSQGMAQCRHYLKERFHHIEWKEWIDTARAAHDLAKGILPPTAAVIAPERASEIYGLKVMAKNIQDHSPNLTAFIIVKKYNGKES
ncbi:prephenate dehydratase domain-containing protein [Legionella israelensis]|uniref:prephenate dehydratase domain-containing protein n=1 Tax=Legionella israelensis TaxID=454 RepID=UPI001FD31997|nr:prephenate dehydratase domain-containing protein [Legionella israelensis]